jgi:hypothetical protein
MMMLLVRLINVKNSIQLMGIIIDEGTWMDDLSSKINEYMPYQQWSYSFDDDSLAILAEYGTPVPDNISDFGEVVYNGDFNG